MKIHINYIFLVLILTSLRFYAIQFSMNASINIIKMQQDTGHKFIGSPPTVLKFQLLQKDTVAIDIFDIKGEKKLCYFYCVLDSGKHDISIDAKELKRGVYSVRVKSGDKLILKKKIIVLK